jgi:hypothetical protein
MIEERLEALGFCGGTSGVECEDYCICPIPQAEGDSATDCLNNPIPAESRSGWCYVDPARGRGSDELVAHCPGTQRGTVRILPEVVADVSKVYVLACLGGDVVSGETAPGPGALGTPCLPRSERNHDFHGFDLTEITFEFGSPDCASNTCLVNHFQGRVSCPYGQPEDPPADDPDFTCHRPGPDGQVTVAVDPQLLARRAEDHVICSCRCDGPDPSDSYCECPADMECARLVPYSDVPNTGSYVGSYCIPRGTGYDQLYPPDPQVCLLEQMNCGDPPPS